MGDPAEASQRIERLLEEVRAVASPLAWRRVDELVRAVVSLYGDGLARVHAVLDERQRETLADDELVGSLLALHGLHPLAADARIRAALAEAAPRLGRVELLALDGATARLRALDDPAFTDAGRVIERLVQEAAPEVERVEVEGLRPPPRPGPLVQIDLARSRAGRAP